MTWDGLAAAADARAGTPADAVDGIVPAWVVRPADVGGVRRVVEAACASRRGLVSSGRGRHLDMGAPPRSLDTVLRLDRLDRVLAHEPADMTVTAEAGCTLAALGDVLAHAGQWLPIDPPCAAETTVGGLVAANLSGPLRASEGTVRDHLIGIAVVGTGGTLVRGGGRVVKNVAGYDLPKLHVGALGTVGVVVEATFKVRPRPAHEDAVIMEVEGVAAAVDEALALRDAVEPTWLELAHPASLLGGSRSRTAVVAGFAGARAWVDEAVARVERRAMSIPATRRPDGGALRQTAADLAARRASAIIRVTTLPTALGSALAPAFERSRTGDPAVDLSVHVTSGVARIGVHRPADVAPVLEEVRRSAPAGSPVVVERGDAAVKRGIDVWGRLEAGAGAVLMSRIKASFDPAGVFAAGRFVSGL